MTPEVLSRLSALLDEALQLDASARETWLAALPGDAAELGPTLRALLARHLSKETGDLLERPPQFTLPASADTPAMAFRPGDTVGPYRLLRSLGHGGMGEVWQAERADGTLKRKVALKLPHVTWAPGLAERFAREREILASLEHPNIARLYDAGLDPHGRPYMALEYVEGLPIDAFCMQRALPVEARLRLLLQVADAVAFAHSRLVIHRDLKPSNILVTEDGQVRLLDFGIAKLMEGDTAQETALTRLGGRALTLDYASPEQIRGEPIGTPSDVYTLGVVAFELLAGARPYRLKRQSAAELEEAIANVDPPLASAVADEGVLKKQLAGDLDAILNKALKKHPTDRYPTVDALAQDWRSHLTGQRVHARPDTLGYRMLRFARRQRTTIMAGGAAVVVLGLALGFGATAVVIAALLIGLGGALWQARRAVAERDRALALVERNFAANVFLDTLLTKAASAGPLTADQLLQRSERLMEVEVKGNAEHQAYLLGLLASCYSQLNQPAHAEPLLARAVELARGVSDASLHDSLLGKKAVIAGRLGRNQEAASVLDGILVRRGITPEVRAEVHAQRATVADWDGDVAIALHHAREALRWYRSAKYLPRRDEPTYLALLAWVYHCNGRGEEADRHQAAAVAAFEALGLGDSPAALQNIENWAMVQQERGDLHGALELYERLLAAYAKSSFDAKPLLFGLANSAYALTHIGRYDEAESRYRQSLELAKAQHFPLVAYNIRLCIVELYAAQDRAEDAEGELRAAEVERTVEVSDGSAATFARQLAVAQLALLKGDTGAAVTVYSMALESKRVAAGSINALLGRAAAYVQASALDLALADAREALDYAQRLQGHKPTSFRTGLAHLIVARVQDRKGDLAAARQAARKAVEQLSSSVVENHPALSLAHRLASTANN